MNNHLTRSACALFAILALLTAVLPAVRAEDRNLYVTGYTITSGGNTLNKLEKGSSADITVSIKDTSDGTGSSSPSSLDITKLDDSFSGGSISVSRTSPDGAPRVYAVTLSGIKYTGTGQTLRLQVGRAGEPDSYQTLDVTISEAKVYEDAPKRTYDDEPKEPAPAPMVLISRSEMAKPIEAGQEIELDVTVRNLSASRLKSPVITFTPSDGLSISGGSTSFALADIAAKQSATLTIHLKAASVIASPNQSLGVDMKFNYNNNISTIQGSITDKISIPALGRENTPQPVVLVTRSAMDKPIAPDETRDVTISFKNAGSTKLVSPVATVAPSDSLIVLNETSTFVLEDIAPGATRDIVVRVKALKEISSTNQSISTELKYSYDSGGMLTQATASDRINFSALVPSKADTPVPNIVIRSFTYGESSVAAGSSFPLRFAFENTGSIKIENIVVTVDGGENFTMDGGTNTFHYNALAAGAAQTQEVPMRAVPNGKSGAQSIGVGFKYEYVDGDKRTSASADIRISVPIYQPDRFQLNSPVVPETVNVGEEAEVTMAYVNKGKDDISNVEAIVEGDGVDTPARTQYLGNITAGTSGTIGFALTPTAAGPVDVVLKISYENADQQIQVKTFPVTLQAEELPPPDDFGDELPPMEEPGLPWLWIGLGVAAAAGIAAVVVIRRKKHAKAAADGWDSWEDETPDDAGKES